MSNKSLRQKAYEWLKKKIISLEFPMGSSLSESELARELEMGRTPVREALQLLASEQLIVIIPRKGMFVSSLNFAEFENLLEVRLMLEIHVVRSLTGKRRQIAAVDPKRIKALRDLFDDIDPLVEARDIDALLLIERQFHEGIVALLNNPTLDEMARHVYDLVMRTWYLSFRNRDRQNLRETMYENLKILETIDNCSADEAEQVVYEHVMDFRDKIFQQPQAY